MTTALHLTDEYAFTTTDEGIEDRDDLSVSWSSGVDDPYYDYGLMTIREEKEDEDDLETTDWDLGLFEENIALDPCDCESYHERREESHGPNGDEKMIVNYSWHTFEVTEDHFDMDMNEAEEDSACIVYSSMVSATSNDVEADSRSYAYVHVSNAVGSTGGTETCFLQNM